MLFLLFCWVLFYVVFVVLLGFVLCCFCCFVGFWVVFDCIIVFIFKLGGWGRCAVPSKGEIISYFCILASCVSHVYMYNFQSFF